MQILVEDHCAFVLTITLLQKILVTLLIVFVISFAVFYERILIFVTIQTIYTLRCYCVIGFVTTIRAVMS